MRETILYLLVTVTAPIYGGQVCPFMAGLPVGEFESYVIPPILIILAIRYFLQPIYVEKAPYIKQGLRQFILDMSLFTLAGITASVVLHVLPGLPLWQSGSKLTLAFITGGLFASLNLALTRERQIIKEAIQSKDTAPPPEGFFPRSKMFTLIAVTATVLATTVLVLLILRDLNWLTQQPPNVRDFSQAIQSVIIEILLVMGLLLAFSVNLIFNISKNLQMLFQLETSALERVSKGDLSVQVPVITQDELGYIAGVTNTMISSLRDHLRIRKGLEIAAEIQRNFLPTSTPKVEGMDIAGLSNFCEETGGDFYDFIPCENGTLVVVGDVVGHGLESALLMASTRSFIRQAADTISSPGDILNTVNRQLCRDTQESGRFVSCVIILLHKEEDFISWASAGHQPPMRHCQDTQIFIDLSGIDPVIGVEPSWEYSTQQMEKLADEESLILFSDGVTEAFDEDGKMFGNEKLQDSIIKHVEKAAQEMLSSIVDDVLDHSKNGKLDDDLTLVVLKKSSKHLS